MSINTLTNNLPSRRKTFHSWKDFEIVSFHSWHKWNANIPNCSIIRTFLLNTRVICGNSTEVVALDYYLVCKLNENFKLREHTTITAQEIQSFHLVNFMKRRKEGAIKRAILKITAGNYLKQMWFGTCAPISFQHTWNHPAATENTEKRNTITITLRHAVKISDKRTQRYINTKLSTRNTSDYFLSLTSFQSN